MNEPRPALEPPALEQPTLQQPTLEQPGLEQPGLEQPGLERSEPRYTIDALARVTGATTRTIRSYQDRGLLPPPVIVGRTGHYDSDHVARLRVISRLLDEHFSLASIGALLHAWETGESLAHILGFVDDAVAAGAGAVGPTVADELQAAGVPAEVARAELARLRDDCDRIARRFAALAARYLAPPADATAVANASSRATVLRALPVEAAAALAEALARTLDPGAAHIDLTGGDPVVDDPTGDPTGGALTGGSPPGGDPPARSVDVGVRGASAAG